MSVICITQARLGSSRLPAKVLKKIHDISLIEYHFERVKLSTSIDQHWLSTSDEITDKQLVNFANQRAWRVFTGSEQNVLERFYHTALAAGAKPDDTIVRLTGDCPLVCPQVLDDVIHQHLIHNSNGYSHLSLEYHPRGFDVEVFSMACLFSAYENARLEAELEHVTYYMYSHPKDFAIHTVKQGNPFWSKYRLCVDEMQDFKLVEALLVLLKTLNLDWRYVTGQQICELLEQHPKISEINQQVRQKTVH